MGECGDRSGLRVRSPADEAGQLSVGPAGTQVAVARSEGFLHLGEHLRVEHPVAAVGEVLRLIVGLYVQKSREVFRMYGDPTIQAPLPQLQGNRLQLLRTRPAESVDVGHRRSVIQVKGEGAVSPLRCEVIYDQKRRQPQFLGIDV